MLKFADSFVGGVRGIVEARNGDIWLNAATGFVHVPAKELEAALANPTHALRARLIKEGDFAGIVQIVPDRFNAPRSPPIVTIRTMVADGQAVGETRVLDAGTRTLEIQYQGVNLTTPEDVIFRYRLEAYDDAWQEAGHRTEAIYTRLPPGTYTFSVIASNGDGVWTEPVSSGPFTVLPAFYQTRWFVATALAVVALAVALAYRLRVRQISRMMSARFDERLAERTRVARELHDTLLQTVHGSKMVADRALRDAGDRDRLVRALEQVSGWSVAATRTPMCRCQSLAVPENCIPSSATRSTASAMKRFATHACTLARVASRPRSSTPATSRCESATTASASPQPCWNPAERATSAFAACASAPIVSVRSSR
jgi:hypothetical protein